MGILFLLYLNDPSLVKMPGLEASISSVACVAKLQCLSSLIVTAVRALASSLNSHVHISLFALHIPFIVSTVNFAIKILLTNAFRKSPRVTKKPKQMRSISVPLSE